MKSAAAGILVALTLVFGGVFFLRGSAAETAPVAGSNVGMEDGKQIVTIRAKGGYLPGTSAVKAGVPTVLRFETAATFDCASSVRIPSLGISKNLPPSGATDIDVGVLQPGKLLGTCGMGMYRFTINAEG